MPGRGNPPILLAGDFDAGERERWVEALASAMPEAEWLDSPGARRRADEVRAAVVANPAPGTLAGWPRLGFVQSLWAGVDRLLADTTLPAGVPVARMVDPAMTAAMAETAHWAVLALHRGFFAYARRQREGRWQPHAQRRADECPVLLLGFGEMAQAVARRLAGAGHAVEAVARRLPPPECEVGGVKVHAVPELRGAIHDGALDALLGRAQVLVNLLPLTASTRDVIDARVLAALPPGAGVVNLGRGAHLVEADLLAALDSGHLRDAVLDVFRTEPLPAAHPFWAHPRVTLLPHAAAMTDERSAAAVAAANLRAVFAGAAPRHLVDRARGY
jgi:glyoxylate/hydroxypyruvate reductase A